MNRKCEILDLKYNFGDMEQHLFPVVLFGDCDVVLIDCGYPGSLDLLEEQLRKHNIQPEELTRLILTHQDDDHMGAAAELKEAYPLIKITASRLEAPYIPENLKISGFSRVKRFRINFQKIKKHLENNFVPDIGI